VVKNAKSLAELAVSFKNPGKLIVRECWQRRIPPGSLMSALREDVAKVVERSCVDLDDGTLKES
jgi:hypothetical protein